MALTCTQYCHLCTQIVGTHMDIVGQTLSDPLRVGHAVLSVAPGVRHAHASRRPWTPSARAAAQIGGDAGARSPRALANTIWQQGKTKASLERSPCSSAWRSSSVKKPV